MSLKANVLHIQYSGTIEELKIEYPLPSFFAKFKNNSLKIQNTDKFTIITRSYNTPGGINTEKFICKRKDYEKVILPEKVIPVANILDDYTNQQLISFITSYNRLFTMKFKDINLEITTKDNVSASQKEIEFKCTIYDNDTGVYLEFPSLSTSYDYLVQFQSYAKYRKLIRRAIVNDLLAIALGVLEELTEEVRMYCYTSKVPYFLDELKYS